MKTFISRCKFTSQGISNIGSTTERSAGFKAAAKKLGCKVKDIYWTLGEYDGLVIFDAPDAETATALMLQLGSAGNLSTATNRAFSAAEMDKILAKSQGG